ncbi:glycogen debranching protein GlgX [Celerinatantimonas yamalensis]|uniref:Glycogen debranching protein GlgX n=1 Tax=Celerinatantimonas yamalensis TaxID=559956 RepID=A0ABW9G1E1_9GAMM
MCSALSKSPLQQLGLFALYYGKRFPMGASVDEHGCNFVVFAGSAQTVELCLFDDEEQEIARFVLPSKYGAFHYGYVQGVSAGQFYGYRANGKFQPQWGQIVMPDKLLIDPYTKALSRLQLWNDQLYAQEDGTMIAKSVVIDDEAFDWQHVTKPGIPQGETIIYELHVKGFTKLHPEVPAPFRGTYLGLVQPPVIEYLKSLGVTSLQLMPIAAFMSESRLNGLGLTNYWGYNPIAFFAPEPRYSVSDAVSEFKTMVRELHRHGLEVILDVVFNHTAEGGKGGPVISLRGLANYCYYLFEANGLQPEFENYANYSGCGNTVNVANSLTLKMVTDCLRYWAVQMQVDGFRFDLAVTVGREANGFNQFNAFFKVLQQDPVLSRVKLIAEPWDIGPNGYQVGSFPYDWHECNDHFRDNVRGFWRGDDGQLGEFATRMMGSRDLFPADFRSIHTSINFICYHDGFTLHDLVSYQQRHNDANKENNRDGHGHNISANYGCEGLTDDPAIIALRNQQKRNLIASLFLAQGIPHFLAGDEFSRTQQGNNNAYCQDNAISWVDWQLRDTEAALVRFTQSIISLRQRFEVFKHLRLGDDSFPGGRQINAREHRVQWLRPDGQRMQQSEWDNILSKAIMVEYVCTCHCNEHLILVINAGPKQIHFHLPELGASQHWYRWIDTQFNEVADGEKMLSGRNTLLIAHSLQLFEASSL